MISNWLYWQSPTADAAPLAIHHSKPKREPSLKKLKAAAEVRKQATTTARKKETSAYYTDDYWVPAALALPQPVAPDSGFKSRDDRRKKNRPSDAQLSNPKKKDSSKFRFGWVVPIGTSIVAAIAVDRLRIGEPVTGIQEHVAGSVALAIVNSSSMQVVLAGVTWYLIGMYMLEIVEALRRK